VEAHITALLPASTAFEIATVIPLSLKEPVGLRPSYFKNTSPLKPIAFARFSACMRGVLPSQRVIMGVPSVIGKKSLYL